MCSVFCICSTRDGVLAPAQRVEDGGVGVDTVSGCGPDDGSNAGEQVGAPVGAEASRDFPIGGGWPKFDALAEERHQRRIGG